MKKELFELKRNMRIELCNITKITGYIVDNNRDCRLEFTKTFLNIPETEQFKYLDIFGKVLSGKPGKNMFQLDFLDKERARYLNAIANTELKEDEVRQIFLEEIAESIDVSNKTYTLELNRLSAQMVVLLDSKCKVRSMELRRSLEHSHPLQKSRRSVRYCLRIWILTPQHLEQCA